MVRVDRVQAIKGPGTCIYCLQVRELEEEHVPPQCLFAESARADLPIFGACRTCNDARSMDDEYFRDVLVDLMLRDLDTPELRELRSAVRSSEQRRLMRGSRPLFPQQGSELRVDAERIKNMVCRITAAMFMVETNTFLQPGWDISGDFVPHNDPDSERLRSAIATLPRRSWGRGAFQYTYAVHRREPRMTQWVYCFYGAAYFHAVTNAPGLIGVPAYFGKGDCSDYETGASLIGRP